MVLGVQWLRTLGPIIWDFLQLTMQLSFLGKTIIFKGFNTAGSTLEEGSNFFKASQVSKRGLLLQLMPQVQATSTILIHEDLQSLVAEFVVVFEEPKGLPP